MSRVNNEAVNTTAVKDILMYGTVYDTDGHESSSVKTLICSKGLSCVVVAHDDNEIQFVSYNAIVLLHGTCEGVAVGQRVYMNPATGDLQGTPIEGQDHNAYCVGIRLPNRYSSDGIERHVIQIQSFGMYIQDPPTHVTNDLPYKNHDTVLKAMNEAMVTYNAKGDITQTKPQHNKTGWEYVGEQCPVCGGQLVYRKNSQNNTKFIGCQNWSNGCRFSCATDKLDEILHGPTRPKLVDDDLPF